MKLGESYNRPCHVSDGNCAMLVHAGGFSPTSYTYVGLFIRALGAVGAVGPGRRGSGMPPNPAGATAIRDPPSPAGATACSVLEH